MEVTVNIDGTGVCDARTPVGFLNHMIDQIASHGLFDITVVADGDTWIDDHHTTEDIALAFGTALSQALGDRKGIHRCAAAARFCIIRMPCNVFMPFSQVPSLHARLLCIGVAFS